MKKNNVQNKGKKKRYIVAAILFIFVFLFIFCCANEIIKIITSSNDYTLSSIIAVCVAGCFLLFGILPKKKRDFKNIEHGSSKWGDFKDLKRLANHDHEKNILFSNNVKLNCDTRATGLNNHTLAIGGTGAGKSFFFVTPNLLQMNQSYVITDPKGEHFEQKSKMLRDNGYEIKIFNIVDFAKSMKFNPIAYFEKASDIKRFITMFISNTDGDKTHPQSNDDFWVKSEKLWLMAILGYLDECCLPHEKNLNSVVYLLDCSKAKDEDEDFQSAVDILFADLEKNNPQSFAAKQYKKYKQAAGKTAKSILVSLGVRLADFDLPEISDLISDDELELEKIGDEKTALFIIIDDLDSTYNYIAAILLDIMFNVLKNKADKEPSKRLKIPVSCFLDEFANIGKFQNFHILISIIRSRGVCLFIILQSLAQIKSIYKETWEIIEGNCDIALFLGGKGESTQKYVSEVMVGKATIDTVSTGGSGGGMSMGYNSYNMNEQKAGRNLIDENEVSRLDIDECIVSIRGFQPFKDKKINPKNHKNYNQLAYDDANVYSLFDKTDFAKVPIEYITEIEIKEVA